MVVTTIGILGAGQAGSTLAQALVTVGYDVVLANSRSPRTLEPLVRALGPRVRAARAADAAAAADLAVTAFPYRPDDELPAAELVGKVVVDTNNYMAWRDGTCPDVEAGRVTVHELRQRRLPTSRVAAAFTHVQFHPRSPLRVPSDAVPALVRLSRPAGVPDRKALVVASDHPDAVRAVAELYDALGYDAVGLTPLSESWRVGPGTPAWNASFDGQTRDELVRNLDRARRAVR